jgi:conjugal transfer mating pair stabilization protein TraN
MQEQIRNQIDHWGSAKSPNCAGLTASELAAVNWDLVDLSEWLALLNIAGKYPTQREVTLEGLTGSGSQFNFNNTTDPRPNTAQRTLDRINESGEDLEQLRIEGGMRLWGMGGGGSREKRGNRKHK